MSYVPGYGPLPCCFMICGEAPGREEAARNRPFVGKAGRVQERHLARHHLRYSQFYLTNINKTYAEGNPDPTPEQISYWTSHLLSEISQCNPSFILAVGRYAMRWFLGESADLDICRGMPYKAGAFDSSRTNRAPSHCIIVPVTHVASGFYSDDARAFIRQDYDRALTVMKEIRAGKAVSHIHDPYAGREEYLDVTGAELAYRLSIDRPDEDEIGLDTEGIPGSEWSIQISTSPGTGYVLRTMQPDFAEGIVALQRLADRGTEFILHQASTPSGTGYDVRMCRGTGLELRHARIFDTMYALYLMRLESKSLKIAGPRWCGAHMDDYESLIGDVGSQKQLEYLRRIISHSPWPKPESRLIQSNDGTTKLYKPDRIEKTIEGILIDVLTGKRNKDGDLTSPEDRWKKIDKELRRAVVSSLGPFPYGTLDDIPLDRAVYYAGRDADITLRLKSPLLSELKRQDGKSSNKRVRLSSDGNLILPVFEEMQATGMPAVRPHFEQLEDEIQLEMDRIQSRISVSYFSSRPFNPKSPKHVNTLLRRRGLEAAEVTDTGAPSTGKKSIEHLRIEDDAIDSVFKWRELQAIRDMFCRDVLARIPEGEGGYSNPYIIRCALDPAKVHTRRLASSSPNFLATPRRTELGRKIREGYQWPESTESGGQRVFGGWDYSQIEARVLAHLSGDKVLRQIFIDNADIHRQTAAMIFGRDSIEAVTAEERDAAKTINYGILYGLGPPGLMAQLRMRGLVGWHKRRCEQTLQRWFQVYSGVKRYAEFLVDKARSDEMVEDEWGMPRYLPAIHSEDRKLSAEAERESLSHVVSGTAQGMIQRAIIWLASKIRDMQQQGDDVRWHLEVHDELILSFYRDAWDQVNSVIVDGLVNHCGIRLSVPVLAEGHMARTWGQLKD